MRAGGAAPGSSRRLACPHSRRCYHACGTSPAFLVSKPSHVTHQQLRLAAYKPLLLAPTARQASHRCTMVAASLVNACDCRTALPAADRHRQAATSAAMTGILPIGLMVTAATLIDDSSSPRRNDQTNQETVIVPLTCRVTAIALLPWRASGTSSRCRHHQVFLARSLDSAAPTHSLLGLYARLMRLDALQVVKEETVFEPSVRRRGFFLRSEGVRGGVDNVKEFLRY